MTDDDREKWEAERSFRDRELAVAEAESRLKFEELELRRRELRSSRWFNPVLIAVFAAIIAAVGNAYVAWTNGSLERELEDRKSEQTRILEMIKTGDPDSAAANLEFLLNAGLIGDEGGKLRRYLDQREEGAGPVLPSSGGGQMDAEGSAPLASLPKDSPLRKLVPAVGQVMVTAQDGSQFLCTAALIAPETVLASGVCAEPKGQPARSYDYVRQQDGERATPLPAILRETGVERVDGMPGYLLLTVPNLRVPDASMMQLASRPPTVGEPLSTIMFRLGEPRFISGAAGCRVTSVGPRTIEHGCVTGGGTAGAPLFNDRHEIVAIHYAARAGGPGSAVRADWVRPQIGARKRPPAALQPSAAALE